MAHAETHDYETLGVGASLVLAAAGLALGILPLLAQIYVLVR